MSAWANHPARTGMKASAAGYSHRQSGCHAHGLRASPGLAAKGFRSGYSDWSKVQVLILRRTHVGEAY